MPARNFDHDVVVLAVEPTDKLDRYRQIIRTVIADYATWTTRNEVVAETVIDRERDHFEVISMGWDNGVRVHHSVVHLDIINERIWIQHDATNRPVAERLMEAGVPKEDIVLGMYSPRRRAMSGFAVA